MDTGTDSIKAARPRPKTERLVFWVALSLCVAVFVLRVTPLAYNNTNSSDWDQRAYLKIALRISDGGRFTDGNRNPLYPLILSPFASPSIAFFTTAKLVSLTIGCLGLVLIALISRDYIGAGGSLVVTALMMANQEYLTSAAYVDVEVLLTPLFFLTWHLCCRLIAEIDARKPSSIGLALGAGATTALGYLAKGTGLLIPVFFFGALVLQLGWRWVRKRAVWIFLLAFCILAVPYWIHNRTEFGSPLYNVNSAHYMWTDNWENVYVYSPDELPTALSYFRRHSLTEVWERLSEGLLIAPRQWHAAVRVVTNKGVPVAPEGVYGLVLLVTLIGLGEYSLRSWRRVRSWLVFSTVGILGFVGLFAWYHPISVAPRFVMLWTPTLYLTAVWTLTRLWGRCNWSHIDVGVGVAVALIAVASAADRGDSLQLLLTMREHDQLTGRESVSTMSHLVQATSKGDAIVIGPTHGLPYWLAYDREVLSIPHTRTNWPVYQSWLLNNDVSYVVIDEEAWGRRRRLLEEHFVWTDQGLSAKELPDGWRLVRPLSFPCQVCTFSFDAAVFQPDIEKHIVFDDRIVLTGYTRSPVDHDADATLELLLFWELVEPLRETTHIFVHALDSYGDIVDQDDGPLIGDLQQMTDADFPAGAVAKSEHRLSGIDANTSVIQVGLYRWPDQARLLITGPETLAHQDSVRLD